jgi:hypothetical protein
MSDTLTLTLAFLAVGTPLYVTLGCMTVSDVRERRLLAATRRGSHRRAA